MTPEICCVISGSFTKAKPVIDRAWECFEAYGIRVLSPDLGGLVLPRPGSLWSKGAYPLATELHMSEMQAKKRHRQAIAKADFLYVCAPAGYVGSNVALEIGMALGYNLPIYSDHPIDPAILSETPPNGTESLGLIEVESPEEVARHWQGLQLILRELWVPGRHALQRRRTLLDERLNSLAEQRNNGGHSGNSH